MSLVCDKAGQELRDVTQSTRVHSTKRKFSRSGKELGQGRPSQRVFGSQSCQPPGALLSPQGTGQHSASRSPVLAQGAWKAAAGVHRAAERADESTWDLGTYWGERQPPARSPVLGTKLVLQKLEEVMAQEHSPVRPNSTQ